MRRASLFLTMLITAALLLVACGGQETSTSVPSTNVPPITVESTSTVEEATATEAPTMEADTTTPAVPVTGEDSLSRVSSLIGAPVCGMGGDQVGTVQDLVLNFDQTTVSYVVVDANGRAVAVPWTSMTMSSAGGTVTGSGTGADTATATTGSAGTGTTAQQS